MISSRIIRLNRLLRSGTTIKVREYSEKITAEKESWVNPDASLYKKTAETEELLDPRVLKGPPIPIFKEATAILKTEEIKSKTEPVLKKEIKSANPIIKSEEVKARTPEPITSNEEIKIKSEEAVVKFAEKKNKIDEPIITTKESKAKSEEAVVKSDEENKPKVAIFKSEESKSKGGEVVIESKEAEAKNEVLLHKIEDPIVNSDDPVIKSEEQDTKTKERVITRNEPILKTSTILSVESITELTQKQIKETPIFSKIKTDAIKNISADDKTYFKVLEEIADKAITEQMERMARRPGFIESAIRSKLQSAFSATHLDIINESHMHNVPKGAETHFKVVIVSSKFNGQPLIKRHRMVNATLQEELKTNIHALSIVAKTPEQWEQSDKQVESSPTCRGGFGK